MYESNYENRYTPHNYKPTSTKQTNEPESVPPDAVESSEKHYSLKEVAKLVDAPDLSQFINEQYLKIFDIDLRLRQIGVSGKAEKREKIEAVQDIEYDDSRYSRLYEKQLSMKK